MIKESELTKAGIFTKTHGIHGELNAFLEIEPEFFDSTDCFVCFDEGIPIPFFIESIRRRGSAASLIKIVNVDSDVAATFFVGKELYVDKKAYKEFLDENPDEEGEYASDLIGWTVVDASTSLPIGVITDLNLNTANPLFIIDKDDTQVLIPIAEEFINEIREADKVISMSLPDGLVDLNLK